MVKDLRVSSPVDPRNIQQVFSHMKTQMSHIDPLSAITMITHDWTFDRVIRWTLVRSMVQLEFLTILNHELFVGLYS